MSATTAVTELLRSLVGGILKDPAEAEAYSQNPAEYLAAHGVADHDLSEVDIRPIIMEAAKECALPEPVMARVDEYGRGEPAPAPAAQPTPAPPGPSPAREAAPAREAVAGPAPAREPAPAGAPEGVATAPAPMAPALTVEAPPVVPPAGMNPLQSIEQHINYVTYVTHETNTNIVQNLIDNSTHIDNSSSVSLEVGGNVYGDIDLTNEVTNVNATGDGAVAAGGDMRDTNVNTGSGDINQVGSIHANESAVAIGGDATNIQDRSVDNSVTDNSVDNSTNVNIQDSFNDNSTNVNIEDSFNRDDSTNVNIEDSFNTDNSTNIDVDINDSFNTDNSVTDNSVTDNSVDSSINVDVNLGGRSADPAPSDGGRIDDPGFGRGETGDPGLGHDSDPGYDRSPGGDAHDMPGTRDGTPEQYDEKYGDRGRDSGDGEPGMSPQYGVGHVDTGVPQPEAVGGRELQEVPATEEAPAYADAPAYEEPTVAMGSPIEPVMQELVEPVAAEAPPSRAAEPPADDMMMD